MHTENPVVLSIFPNRRGFGYACIDIVEKAVLEAGIASVRPISNERIVARVKRYVEFHKPTIIVVRDPAVATARNSKRVSELNALIDYHSKHNAIPVYRYTRKQVRDVFDVFGALNKDEIAMQIIEWFPELSSRAPSLRRSWEDENYHMGVFDAMALIITHQYLTK